MNFKICFYFLFFISFISFGFSCSTTLDVNSANYAVTAGGESYDCVYVRSGYTLTVDYPLTVTKEMIVYTGGTVTHSANGATKVNWMNITAVNLTVQSGASIDVSGKGYAGGGPGGSSGSGPGRGLGHGTYDGGGGSYGGQAGRGYSGESDSAYGLINLPREIGSGAGGGQDGAGGAGGGYVFLNVSNYFFLNGDIVANGLNGGSDPDGAGGGGSGGGILVYSDDFLGSGNIIANGGNAGSGQSTRGGGSGGRIAVYDYVSNSFLGSLSAYGGSGIFYGGVGSVYIKSSGSLGDLYFKGNIDPSLNGRFVVLNTSVISVSDYNVWTDYSKLRIDSFVNFDGDLFIDNSSIVNLRDGFSCSDMTVNGNSEVWAQNNLALSMNSIEMRVSSLDLTSDSFISGSAYGYTGGSTGSMGSGPGAGLGDGTYNGGGAGHGGIGGTGRVPGGDVYGVATYPETCGSGGGGGQDTFGGSGGGAFIINATGNVVINGNLTSNGANSVHDTDGSGGAGSGGSILVFADTILGSGVVETNGGISGSGQGTAGGGAGGRVAFFYNSNSFSGIVDALGGDNDNDGGVGTIFMKPSSGLGTLYYRGILDTSGSIASSVFNDSVINMNSFDLVLDYANVIVDTDVSTNIGDVFVANNSNFYISGDMKGQDLILSNNGRFLVDNFNGVDMNSIYFDFDDVSIDSTSEFSADGRGYAGGGPSSAGTGPGRGYASGNYDGGGAGYGGHGGNGNGAGGVDYGLFFYPVTSGSGGGGGQDAGGGDGGGAFLLNATSLVLDGVLSSSGMNGFPNGGGSGGGGSGGSLILDVEDFSGSGYLNVIGGDHGVGQSTSAGGSGGRLNIFVSGSNTFSGVISVDGGYGDNNGELGTMFICQEFSSSPGCFNVNGVSLNSIIGQNYSMVVNRTIENQWNAGMLNWTDVGNTSFNYTVTGLNPSVLYIIYEDGANTMNRTSDIGGNLPVFNVNVTNGVNIVVIEDGYDPSNYVVSSSGSSEGGSVFPFGSMIGMVIGFVLLSFVL